VLATLDPRVEWHPLLPVLLGGEAYIGDTRASASWCESLTRPSASFGTEVRDLGDRVLAIGHLSGRGKESGVVTETEIVWLVELKNGKGIRIREYLDPKEALEAAGLRE
jgi:ketosteroid isomerase-like protein